jgi:hypothetical protein
MNISSDNFFRGLSIGILSAIAIPSVVLAQNWNGLPGQDKLTGPDLNDFATWMTPQRAAYFSQFRHPRCPSHTVDNYYGGSLAICNASTIYLEQKKVGVDRSNRNYDRVLQCLRSGSKYCY